ncbi:MAG TPA: arginine--tRNA ligase, partial [Desulfopila sp.]|nr:arginine--tRNA ligase [Desulfopila sp.]
MIRSQLKTILDTCFDRGVAAGKWGETAAGRYTVEVPKRDGQGDFSTNMAMILAGTEKKNPRQLAEVCKEYLEDHDDFVDRVEVAGPGFVNIFIRREVWHRVIAVIAHEQESFGCSDIGGGRRVMVEFVSANPTG